MLIELEAHIGKTWVMTLLLFPWICVFFGMIIATKYILKWQVGALFSTHNKIRTKKIAVGFGLWFGLSALLFWIQFDGAITWQFDLNKFVVLLFVAPLVIGLQSAAEELVFRSFLLKWVGSKFYRAMLPIVFTAALFGFLHASNPEVEILGNWVLIYYVSTGILLGLIAVLDRGIELTIGFHFANNLFAALFITREWQVFHTDALFLDRGLPNYHFSDFAFTFLAQLCFLAICWKCYNWKFKF